MKLANRTLSAWSGAVADGWSARAGNDLAALRPQLRAWATADDLRPIGSSLGVLGHDFGDVLDWFRLLARRSRRARRLLGQPAAVSSLCCGWVQGALRAASVEADASLGLLALRLERLHRGSSDVGETMALVVAALDEPGSPDAIQRIVAAASSLFAPSDTISASVDGPVLVLVHRDPGLPGRVQQLTSMLGADKSVAVLRPRVWIEPLGKSSMHVSSHLHSLAN